MTSRRALLKMASLAPLFHVTPSWAEEMVFSHAITLFKDIKYKSDFKHFDYVNPNAPKGGKLRQVAFGSFDSLNPYSLKGEARVTTVNETLFTRSLDEPQPNMACSPKGFPTPKIFLPSLSASAPKPAFMTACR